MAVNLPWTTIKEDVLKVAEILNDFINTNEEKDVNWVIRDEQGNVIDFVIPNFKKWLNTELKNVVKIDSNLITDNAELVLDNLNIIDTSSKDITVTLPTNIEDGAKLVIMDGRYNAENHPVTVSVGDSKINGETNDLICDVNGFYVGLIYDAAEGSWFTYNVTKLATN